MSCTLDPETCARNWLGTIFGFDFKNIDITVGERVSQGPECSALTAANKEPTVILVITIGFGPITAGFVKPTVMIIYTFSFLKVNKFTYFYSYCTYVQMA